ncbi:MAG TPA: TIGR01777 family oxidoreductase [Acidobacteriota bacterium]|jgi:uncharacterized protein (TIGR01777 family)|nr:TIGR01777 family oxidoreductase [Acidobacteriota bacterium]HNT18431.1 TIGR01777 family oxidoreductase [Acidobacteriota bacterium]HPA26729.1 TIGR01777 family oxidoreductase [Acidobacteriota bacterium]HQO20237.1 TIGR01777 family oxidoreductase [Acidobacteriota bacterium]HQQ46920.1 TIGR01777 family oxidoreductase [Acidobacteriota bacterium]
MSARVLISGAGGFVGSVLVPGLKALGCQVSTLVRRKPLSADEFYWNPEHGILDRKALDSVSVIVNLSGASISARWTKRKRAEIISSRVGTAGFLTDTIIGMDKPPALLVSASAVGYYGYDGPAADEDTPKGEGFLAEVCEKWEKASLPLKEKGTRVVAARLGVVLGKGGGVLKKMLPLFRMNLGGKLGGGSQPVSWVASRELPFVFDFMMRKESLEGAVNVTSPNGVSNAEFTKYLAEALHKKAFLTVPAFALKAAFGPMADELLLGGVRAKPARLEKAGYLFRYGNLEKFLAEELGKP